MTVHSGDDVNPERDAFIRDLLDRAAQIRMPELFAGHPDALWHVANRHGVSVIALRTPSLSHEQLLEIMRYRLVQYLLANQLDADVVFREHLNHEPLVNVSPSDIHVMAGATETGEILCYGTMKAVEAAGEHITLRSRNRSLFPVEEVFGWGVYNRLKILPDLPIARIREMGRLAKNHQLDPFNELIVRGPVEVLLAAFQMVTGPLRQEIDAGVGDIELTVAKKNQDFFHLLSVVIHGVIPYAAEGSFGFFNYQTRTRYPYAFLCSEISDERLAAIEQALALPSKEGIVALMGLKGQLANTHTSLEPAEGGAPLTAADVPQQGGPMPVRRQLLDVGDWLRRTSFFRDLSVAEAAVLGTFMERQAAAVGDTIVRQGEAGDDLYLIEAGRAEVQVVGPSGQRTIVAELGPGDCFGEIALVTGGERTADVIALTPMTLMRLTHDDYARYLAHLVDVDNQITHTALERTRNTLRAVRTSQKGAS